MRQIYARFGIAIILFTGVVAEASNDLKTIKGQWRSECASHQGTTYRNYLAILPASELAADEYPRIDRSLLSADSAVVSVIIEVFKDSECKDSVGFVSPALLHIWKLEEPSSDVRGTQVLEIIDVHSRAVTFDLIGNISSDRFELSSEPHSSVAAPKSLGHVFTRQ